MISRKLDLVSLTSFALIGLTFFIPVSITCTTIFWVAALVCVILKFPLHKLLHSPITWFSTALFLYAALSCFWGEAPFHIQMSMLDKYLKILFFPLLILGFSSKKTRYLAIYFFLAIMAITAFLSILKWTHLLSWRSDDPGEVFYNHIMTGLMMAYAAYVAAWCFYSSNKILYAFLFILFSFQLFFISPGRTGQVVYFLAMSLFVLQIFPLKKALKVLLLSWIIFGAIIYQSPVVHAGAARLYSDLVNYKQRDKDTSIGYRMQFHNYSKELFLRHWLIGNGVGGFEYAFHQENPMPTWRTNYLKEPHSQYWLFLSELGIIGFSLFCLFILALMREIWQLKTMRILGVGILVIFLADCFTDSLAFYTTTNLFFMTFAALSLGERYE